MGLGDGQCIPNGVDVACVRRMAAEPFVHPFLTEKNRSQPVLVAMGRVAHQKGFDVLIRSLAWLKVKYKAKLLVIGHGSAKNRSEEHTSELQSIMRISYAVFCLKKKNQIS